MASEKPTMILLSQTDMTRDEVDALSDAEAWRRIYSIRSEKAKDNRLEICFTGFGKSKKKELAEFAEANNLKVVKSVTKGLDFLCGNDNAGPKKIEDAEKKGAQFLDESQFYNMVKTGELPSET